MLRRSLILFLAFVLLGLGLTAGYVLLRLRGPDDALAEAAEMLRRGDAAGAVRILDLCEPGAGMRENQALLQQLWRVRLDATRRLDNPRRALEDIENLLRLGADDIDLQMARIYYLLREDRGELARQHALDFVARHPQFARGQELAGEACQVAYRDRLRDLSKQLRTDLGYERQQEGITAFLEFLYRPDGDAGGLLALQRLQQLYEYEPRFRQAWPRLQEELRGLRERVQQALGFYLRTLETAQTNKTGDYFIAAYRGASFALRQADRPDDVVAQGEIYLTNYDHRFSTEAAIDIANAHLRDGLDEAVVEVADRFLPAKTWQARLGAGKLDAAVQDLLIAKAFALNRLGRDRDLEQLAQETAAMIGGGLAVNVIPPLAGSLAGVLRQRGESIQPQLVAVCNWFLSRPAPTEGADPLDLLMPLRLELARTDSKATGLVELATTWSGKRPGNLAPLRARARLQLQTGQAAAAMATAIDLLQNAPTDEETLRLLGEAADRSYKDSAQDSDSLLLQCLQRGTGKPDFPPQPVCLLLCAEAALRQQRPDIARICARAGSDSFPWSLWPRMIEARAELDAGNANAAIAVLSRALDRAPDNAQALAMWFDISLRSGLSLAAFLPQVVRTQEDRADIATALLRTALEEHSPASTSLARAAIQRRDPTAELLALAAQALARAGDAAAAQSVLQQSRELGQRAPSPGAPAAQALATIDCIAALAGTVGDVELAERATAELHRITLAGPATAAALLTAARQLDAQDRTRTGYLLTSTALALGDAIESRDAETFQLAGDLAARLGQLDAAAAHYTAALSFPGGETAAESLCRLELLRGDSERARMALAMQQKPTDAALALLSGHSSAAALAQQHVRQDRSDLLAAIPFALGSQVDQQAIGAELRTQPAEVRTEALAIVAMLAEPTLATASIGRARALVARVPASRACALLLARALALAGRGPEAEAIHDRLFQAGCRDLTLFGEAVRATAAKGYVLPPPLRAELRLRASTAADTLPPVVLAYTLRDVATEAANAGNLGMAVQILTELWQRFPEASKASTDDADLLLRHGLIAPAAALLQRLRTTGTAANRLAAGTALYRAAIRLNAGLPAPAAAAMQRTALADLENGELLGPALGFLLTDERRLDAIPAAKLGRWFEALLENVAVGKDDFQPVPYALAYARRRLGDEATRAMVDTAIQAHPAMAPFWVERARILADQRTAHSSLEEARRMLAYVDDPDLTIDFTILAAEQRAVRAADFARLAKVDATRLATPAGTYARGLVELRRGNADQADLLLADAPPRSSGFHLYARALANLMRRTPEARSRSAELFTSLAEHYAKSSLARNAGNFARQLAPN